MNLYFECNMGAAGDMLASALVGLFENTQAVIDELNSLGLEKTEIGYSQKEQCGIAGVHLDIVINGETEAPDSHHSHHHHSHTHRKLSDIFETVDRLNVSEKVRDDIKGIYRIVAEAEAQAHNCEAGEVHFHELGMLDAVADITLCSYLLNRLNPQKILCSPINVGNGEVRCAHGILPVPAPATANILKGIPFYKSNVMTELCTPTGAAILKYFVDEYTDKPDFSAVSQIGIGAGTKELEKANIVRVFSFEAEQIAELSCNVDDMTGEEIAFAVEKIMKEGALDCFVTPAVMKKGRPASLFTVLCNADEAEKFAKLIFKHTSTIGIRKYLPARYKLDRQSSEEKGVRIKRSEGFGTKKAKIEFDDIKKLAEDRDISVFEARKILEKE